MFGNEYSTQEEATAADAAYNNTEPTPATTVPRASTATPSTFYDAFGNEYSTQAEASAADAVTQVQTNTAPAPADWLTSLGSAASGLGSSAKSIYDTVKNTLGLTNAEMLGLGTGALTLFSQLNKPAYNPKTPAQLLAMQPSNTPAGFTPTQLAAMQVPLKVGNQLATQSAASMPSPIVAGTGAPGVTTGPISSAFGAGYGMPVKSQPVAQRYGSSGSDPSISPTYTAQAPDNIAPPVYSFEPWQMNQESLSPYSGGQFPPDYAGPSPVKSDPAGSSIPLKTGLPPGTTLGQTNADGSMVWSGTGWYANTSTPVEKNTLMNPTPTLTSSQVDPSIKASDYAGPLPSPTPSPTPTTSPSNITTPTGALTQINNTPTLTSSQVSPSVYTPASYSTAAQDNALQAAYSQSGYYDSGDYEGFMGSPTARAVQASVSTQGVPTFAKGGSVGPLSRVTPHPCVKQPLTFANGGSEDDESEDPSASDSTPEDPLEDDELEGPMVGFVAGEGGGQDDLVEARLSPGEYVFDAESVSMLGDGNNEEGARKLDELRQKLRAEKRAAPSGKIAPPAKGALSYIKGGLND